MRTRSGRGIRNFFAVPPANTCQTSVASWETMTERLRHKSFFSVFLLLTAAFWMTQCNPERPTTPRSETGAILLDLEVPKGFGESSDGASKAVISRGRIQISGDQLDAPIIRTPSVQGGRLQTRVDDIPVGKVELELAFLESNDDPVWEGNTQVTVVANSTVNATLTLRRVDDQPPNVNFTVNPERGPASTDFRFAAEVDDRHDETESLEIRWDFDNNGSYETAWDTSKGLNYTFPSPGNYRVNLEVKDKEGKTNSISKTVQVENTRPQARAGQDVTRNAGEVVQLEGNESADPDGSSLTYNWLQTAGPPVTLQQPNGPTPSFVPQEAGIYSFSLVVRDGELESPPDEVVVTVVGQTDVPEANTRPVAEAGQDKEATVGELIRLDGRGSTDEEGDALTYDWVQTGGPGVELQGADSALPEFVPEGPGIYTFSLVVHDGQEQSQVDEVTVTVLAVEGPDEPVVNQPPIARAGQDITRNAGETVQLDGRGSTDPEGSNLTYNWTLASGPAVVVLQQPNGPTPSFVPQEAGIYSFSLVVRDGELESPSDEVVVTVVAQTDVPEANTRPVAEAGQDKDATVGELIRLDGRGSTDEEGDGLTYAWVQTGGPGVELQGGDSALPEFVPGGPGIYTFSLVVHDGQEQSQVDEVTVTVLAVEGPDEPVVNQPPVADVRGPEEVEVGELVELNGSQSFDDDGDMLGYTWSQIDGPGVTLSGDNTAFPSFIPSDPGEYIFELVVDDAIDESSPAQVRVRVIEGGLPDLGLPRIAFSSNRDGNPAVFVVNILGREPRKLTNGDGGGDVSPEASPDGLRIAFASYRDGRFDPFDNAPAAEIYVMNDDGSGLFRLTDNEFPDDDPTWAPDGFRIAFVSARHSGDYGYVNSDIFVMNDDGRGQKNLTPEEGGLESEPDWSPDGRKIAFTSFRDFDALGNIQSEIYIMNDDGSNWVNASRNDAIDGNPDWSPDGRKIAFASNRLGNSEIFAMNPDGSGVVNLSRSPDSNDWNPVYGPEGREIAFLSDRDGGQEIFIMGAGGLNQRKLVDGFSAAAWPSWLRVFEGMAKPLK